MRAGAYDYAVFVAFGVRNDGVKFALPKRFLVDDASCVTMTFCQVHFVGHEVGVDGVEGP